MEIPNWMYDKPIAHRGYFNEASPENSLGAFQNAIDRGFAVELDVQILKDDTLIVFHDENFKRMTGKDLSIYEATYEDIKDLRLLDTDEKIPLFDEFLELIRGQIPLMIEFKNETTSNRLEERGYEALKSYQGPYIIQSFNPLSVWWFKKHAPHIVRGQLSYDYNDASFFKRWFLSNVYGNIVTRPHFVIYDIKALDSKVIKRLKKRSMPLFSYTAKSLESYRYAIDQSVPACFEGFDPE
ncbi:glycerophosphodiester phosphodiesterase family protein [Acidaminobacter sp. JC074]|uniref:glycerophosphodiester phosphodiesterase family protein n=1 Tax=Acidaminobacter sp. JC074 TaxID=2530199 RepID=UPI001F0DA764|nr:glycerophosphodiester phosphodiesterase family protein [Acidaminobacter sp. JC074]